MLKRQSTYLRNACRPGVVDAKLLNAQQVLAVGDAAGEGEAVFLCERASANTALHTNQHYKGTTYEKDPTVLDHR